MKIKIVIGVCLGLLFQSCDNNVVTQNSLNESAAKNTKDLAIDSMKNYGEFQSFWKKYREAIMDSNYTEIKEMTQIPLIIKGYEDNDPIIKINAKSFIKLFNDFLKEVKVYYKDSTISRIEFIKKLNDPKEYNGYTESKNWRAIENMEFIKTERGWKLSKIYMDTKGIKLSQIGEAVHGN